MVVLTGFIPEEREEAKRAVGALGTLLPCGILSALKGPRKAPPSVSVSLFIHLSCFPLYQLLE